MVATGLAIVVLAGGLYWFAPYIMASWFWLSGGWFFGTFGALSQLFGASRTIMVGTLLIACCFCRFRMSLAQIGLALAMGWLVCGLSIVTDPLMLARFPEGKVEESVVRLRMFDDIGYVVNRLTSPLGFTFRQDWPDGRLRMLSSLDYWTPPGQAGLPDYPGSRQARVGLLLLSWLWMLSISIIIFKTASHILRYVDRSRGPGLHPAVRNNRVLWQWAAVLAIAWALYGNLGVFGISIGLGTLMVIGVSLSALIAGLACLLIACLLASQRIMLHGEV